MVYRVAIFASGGGSNAENLCDYFEEDPQIEVTHLFCNKAEAGVWERLKEHELQEHIISKSILSNQIDFLPLLEGVDFIVLAGFLLKIPDFLTEAYEGKIINIHPSLLPKHGGKGMYGINVHKAVLAAGDSESGISIHLVNEKYDSGALLFQKSLKVGNGWSAQELAKEVLKLEHRHYPEVVEQWILGEL